MINPNGSLNAGPILPDWGANPRSIRGKLIRRIEDDLLGPLDGEHEAIRGWLDMSSGGPGSGPALAPGM